MRNYEFYITPDEYEEAAQNGVCARLLNARVRQNGWEKRRAIETPPGANRKKDPFVELAEKNGISLTTYRKRVYSLRWSKEKAATTPIQKKPIENWVDIAKVNGIPSNTFYQRVNRYGWDSSVAATTPSIPHGERRKAVRR